MDDDHETPVVSKRKKVTHTPTPLSGPSSSLSLSNFSSIASSLKVSKLVKIEAFNSLKDDPCVWIGSFEKAVEKHGPVEDIGFVSLFHFLDSSCQPWHFSYRRKNKIIIWSDVKEEFCHHMQKQFVEKIALLKKHYTKGQTVKDFVKEQIESHKAFFPKLSDKELILASIGGLPQEIRFELVEYKDAKLSTFLEFCECIDKDVQQANEEEEREEEHEEQRMII